MQQKHRLCTHRDQEGWKVFQCTIFKINYEVSALKVRFPTPCQIYCSILRKKQRVKNAREKKELLFIIIYLHTFCYIFRLLKLTLIMWDRNNQLMVQSELGKVFADGNAKILLLLADAGWAVKKI